MYTRFHWLAAAVAVVTIGCDSGGGGGGGGGGGQQFADGCSSHFDCGAELVCVAAACQSAFPRTYRITFGSASVRAAKENGDAWDPFGGAPDPRVVLERDGVAICQTSVAQDTFAPQWNEFCDVQLFQTSVLTFWLYDADVDFDDPVGGLEFSAPFCDTCLKSGNISLSQLDGVQSWSATIAIK